jgi:oligosaccharide translocation protein RFT1
LKIRGGTPISPTRTITGTTLGVAQKFTAGCAGAMVTSKAETTGKPCKQPSREAVTPITQDHDDSGKEEISVGQAAARGTLLTLLLRVISFVCTQWTLRLVDPATLGKVNIQLELILTTVLFISREGFRLALTRNIAPTNWNVAWLTIPVVTLVAGGALGWHVWMVGAATTAASAEQERQQEAAAKDYDLDYFQAGILYCLASWIEGCAEPAVLYCLRRMDVAARVAAEGLATVVKTLATVIILQPSITHHLSDDWPVTALSIAQLLYAVTYAIFLYSRTLPAMHSKGLFPSFSSFSNLDMATISLTFVFTLQGFFKHLLTEADRIVLSTVSDNYDQGVYAMGSAYGGMAARILLQPLEENARLLWSRLAFEKPPPRKNKERIIDPLEQSYTVLVKFVLLIGFVFGTVAVNYTHLLLSILAGHKWGSNPQASAVLSAFCVYTAFLAWNGMTEAFVYGVTTSQLEVGRLGIAHTLTGIVFAITAPLLVSQYGAVGLVTANCVAMSVRSLYSVHFAARYFVDRQQQAQDEGKPNPSAVVATLRRLLQQMIPHPVLLGCFLGAWALTRWSWKRVQQQSYSDNFYDEYDIRQKEWLLLSTQHVGVGLSCVLGIGSVLYAVEVDFRRSLVSMLRRRPKQD